MRSWFAGRPEFWSWARVVAVEGGLVHFEQVGRCAVPTLAADLTFVHVNGGRAWSGLADWDLDRPLAVGDRVLAADGGGSLPATVVRIDDDGSVLLQIDPQALRT